ncbi:MAG: RNA polymerase sigma factor, partial [Planctomycetota bacterium]
MPSQPDSRDPFAARSDQDLIDAANGGDVAAFEALYLRYRDWCVRMAYRFRGDHDEALDVLQEAWTYVLRKFPGFVLTGKMTTFLYPVVKHTALHAKR